MKIIGTTGGNYPRAIVEMSEREFRNIIGEHQGGLPAVGSEVMVSKIWDALQTARESKKLMDSARGRLEQMQVALETLGGEILSVVGEDAD